MNYARFLMLLAVAIAGTLSIPLRELGELEWSPAQAAAARCLIGTLIIGILYRKEVSLIRKDLPNTLLMGLGTVLAMGGYLYAIKYIAAGTAAALFFIGPIWVILLSKEKTRRELLACLTGLAGAFTILAGNFFSETWSGVGILAGITASIGFAIFFIFSQRAGKHVSGKALAFWSWALAGMAFTPTLVGAPVTWEAIPWVAFIGLFNGTLYVLVFFAALGRIGNEKESSIWQYGELVSATVVGMIYFSEALTLTSGVGSMLIIIAGVLIATKPQEQS